MAGRIAGMRAWYSDLSLGEKGILWMSGGIVCGTFWGTYDRRLKFRAPESDFLVMTSYATAPDKKKAFEVAWSDAARLAQRKPGYEWTKTYKALDWEGSPFNYVSFRMWSEEASYKRLDHFDSVWKELMKRLNETVEGAPKNSVYRIVIDDSVRRIIE
mmetsp:Transcript_28681/g.75961  ORF Transcript_28681/g.75961 Transcript_28681/m.75961 type:complete len:158 (+) Transcript_28681:112-585(+)